MHLRPELQVAAGSFSLKASGQPIRVLAFGDFGDGSDGQREVAAATLQYHRQRPFDFAITLGDNFYDKGMKSVDDPRWKIWWDQLYDPLGIQFYATLGNHDYGFRESPEAEILYSRKSPSWRMPATQYTFTAGWVQFFAIDSEVMTPYQLEWLQKELDASTFRWKVVYGHHPIYSHGKHGDDQKLITELLPVLKGRADIYLAGHDHDMQHLKPEGNLHFFVCGTGGKIRPIRRGPRSLFAESSLGFAMLEADGSSMKVTFIDEVLHPLYEYTLKK
jgi:predicted phosphodiesterase